MPGERLLVPVADSSTIRATVDYAVERAVADATAEAPGLVRFVYVYSPEAVSTAAEAAPDDASERLEEADRILQRARVWAEEDAGDAIDRLDVETGYVGTEEYLFSPDDVARALREESRRHGVDRIVLDPEYDAGVGAPFLRPLEAELARARDLEIIEAPVEPRTRRLPLLNRSTPVQVGALFGISYLFYQVLSGGFYALDFVTGAVSATIVAVALSRVTFSRDPDLRSPLRLLRAALYVPYLLYEIVKANVQIAAVILHPRLPIDPRYVRVRPAVWGGIPLTTLANSITLTPGTLTVRVQGRTLLVHTLVPAAREGLLDGALERAVRFVFYGRRAVRIDGLRERGAGSVVEDLDADDPRDEGPDVRAAPAEADGDAAAGGDRE